MHVQQEGEGGGWQGGQGSRREWLKEGRRARGNWFRGRARDERGGVQVGKAMRRWGNSVGAKLEAASTKMRARRDGKMGGWAWGAGLEGWLCPKRKGLCIRVTGLSWARCGEAPAFVRRRLHEARAKMAVCERQRRAFADWCLGQRPPSAWRRGPGAASASEGRRGGAGHGSEPHSNQLNGGVALGGRGEGDNGGTHGRGGRETQAENMRRGDTPT